MRIPMLANRRFVLLGYCSAPEARVIEWTALYRETSRGGLKCVMRESEYGSFASAS